MILRLFLLASCFASALKAHTQSSATAALPEKYFITKRDKLFDSDKPLFITLKGNLRELLNDRTGEAKYHPVTLLYRDEDSSEVSVPVNIKTRGHFRRIKSNCIYPPLLLQFPESEKQTESFFPKKAKLKLVMPCRSEDYVVKEWLVYKIYNLVTPESFKARLVKVTLNNEKDNKIMTPFYGILLEEEQLMAKRNHEVAVNRKLTSDMTEPESYLKMTVFQYLIGNTDWSIEFLQNIKLVAPDSTSLPAAVPYDFDHAGIVGAPYAEPAEALQLSSVRERRYRGYCIQDMSAFDSSIACFNRIKNDVYTLYSNNPLLDSKYIKSTLQYLDEFYKTINNPKSLQKEFGYPCDRSGTGNVIIKGLKED